MKRSLVLILGAVLLWMGLSPSAGATPRIVSPVDDTIYVAEADPMVAVYEAELDMLVVRAEGEAKAPVAATERADPAPAAGAEPPPNESRTASTGNASSGEPEAQATRKTRTASSSGGASSGVKDGISVAGITYYF